MPPFSGSVTARLDRAVGTWTLADPTLATFTVGNLGRRVSGTIPVLSAQTDVAEDGTVCAVSAVLDIGAIATGHSRRDKDLRKAALLDLDNHPRLSFTGTDVTARDESWVVTGLLTVKGTTREITLDASADQQDDATMRVRATGQLDRRHYGVKAPRLMIRTLVDLEIDVTLRRR